MSEPVKTRSRTAALGKFVLVAVLAAAVAAFVSANWRDRIFSLVVTNVQTKAGIVILCSVAVGFILGWAFLWSASDRN